MISFSGKIIFTIIYYIS